MSQKTEARLVRAIGQGGRVRVRDEQTGLFVQCCKAWRQSLERGALLSVLVHMRADGECFVLMPLASS